MQSEAIVAIQWVVDFKELWVADFDRLGRRLAAGPEACSWGRPGSLPLGRRPAGSPGCRNSDTQLADIKDPLNVDPLTHLYILLLPSLAREILNKKEMRVV